MDFNQRLKNLRTAKNISQDALAYDLNVSADTVSRWELGDSTPDMGDLKKLSEYFDISLDRLVTGAEAEKNMPSCGYEYKSKATLFGLPLVHINLSGQRRTRRIKKAKGIIAIGDVAIGIVAIGGFSMGAIALGGFSLGLLAFGGFAAGIAALGGMAFGAVLAVGGMAFAGTLAMGGMAIGGNAIGGMAIGKNIAMGGYAKGIIAIGDETEGQFLYGLYQISVGQFRALAVDYTNVPGWVIKIYEVFMQSQ